MSDDLNNNFNAYCRKECIDLGINFNIYVLQAGAWPLTQSSLSPFAIPQPLEKSVSYFEKFYNGKFSGRKLTWLHHLCNAEIKFMFTKRPYSVSVGTFTMAILLLFETCDSMQYWELQVLFNNIMNSFLIYFLINFIFQTNTKLTDDQLSRNLQSLVEAKILLVSEDESAAESESSSNQRISPETVYTLNKNYYNKRLKFKVNPVHQKETQQIVMVLI